MPFKLRSYNNVTVLLLCFHFVSNSWPCYEQRLEAICRDVARAPAFQADHFCGVACVTTRCTLNSDNCLVHLVTYALLQTCGELPRQLICQQWRSDNFPANRLGIACILCDCWLVRPALGTRATWQNGYLLGTEPQVCVNDWCLIVPPHRLSWRRKSPAGQHISDQEAQYFWEWFWEISSGFFLGLNFIRWGHDGKHGWGSSTLIMG